jgi:DMSO/TMAO reductase YedYZ molybdopterin-dependent catalytic subunit
VSEILFTGLDRGIEGGVEQNYQWSLPLSVALHDDVLLAWAMNGAPLEPQHGFPLRVIVPGWYGMAHVKWLHAITALSTPFDGYQQVVAYRYNQSREEPGSPVTLMRVRALLIPDFLTRVRVVQRGSVELRGRAWSGQATITRVEVSCDGGETWAPAQIGEPQKAYSWQSWRYLWDASSPGTYQLCCHAYDSAGNVQPLEQYWTARGMGNNAVQRVGVVVV